MLNEVELTVRMEEDLDFLTVEPRVKQDIYPYSMARIVDVEGFFREYPKSRMTAPFDFKVTDQWAPWNQQTFRVDSESADHSRRVIRPSNRMQHIFFNRFLSRRQKCPFPL